MAVYWKVEVQAYGPNVRTLRPREKFVLEFDTEETVMEFIAQLTGAFPNRFSTISTRVVVSEKSDITKSIAKAVSFFA